jgi:putative FmdB family regulatory protein
MPIYEYRCTGCSHDFSKLQKVSAEAPPCPECGETEVAKKVSHTSFQLKGGGWYVTDFRDGGGGPGAAKKPESESEPKSSEPKSSEAPAAAAKPDAAKPASGGDSKPAPKAESKPAASKPARTGPA